MATILAKRLCRRDLGPPGSFVTHQQLGLIDDRREPPINWMQRPCSVRGIERPAANGMNEVWPMFRRISTVAVMVVVSGLVW